MQLTIATTQNTTVYEGTIDQVNLPTENGTLTVFQNHIPSVVKLVPGVIQISSGGKTSKSLSISKGIALVDGSYCFCGYDATFGETGGASWKSTTSWIEITESEKLWKCGGD